jgi:hypothetical protein
MYFSQILFGGGNPLFFASHKIYRFVITPTWEKAEVADAELS